MISIDEEHLIEVRQIPRLLPKRPNGKRIHITAVYRWIQRGKRGVRLATIKIGGTRYTSIEALQRFGEASSNRAQPKQLRPTTKQRQRQMEKASAEVARILGVKEDDRR